MTSSSVVSPPLLSFLSVLCLLLSHASSAVAQSPLVISAVSGCTDVGNATTECAPSAWLTVWGSGFSTNASLPMTFSIADLWSTQVSSSSVDAQGQSFKVYVSNVAAPRGVQLNVTVSIPALNVTSGPFPGLSLVAYADPVLLSIAGCDGSGNLTSACQPDSSVLVFTGLNLDALNGPQSVQTTTPGGGTSGVNFAFNNPRYSNSTVNSSTIVLVLQDVYQYIVRDVHYNGTLQIYFQYWGGIRTQPLSLSLVPLPPPQVQSVASRGCNDSAATGAQIVDCVGGYSNMQLVGHYYYAPFSVQVGGQPCFIAGQGTTWYGPKYASCQLPSLPGGVYDVNVTTAGGTLILPQAVQMSFAPSLARVLSSECGVDSGSTPTNVRMKCVGGELLTLTGQNFRTDVDSFRVTITGYYNRSQQLDCLSPAFLNSSHLTCVLPVPPVSYFAINSSGSTAGVVLVQVLYDGLQGSNMNQLTVYDSLQSPVFTSLTGPGCSGPVVDPLTSLYPTFLGCYATAELLTVTGARFVPGPGTLNVQTGLGIYCNPVTSDPPANSSYVQCKLGGALNNPSALTTANSFYVVTSQAGGWLSSRLFYVRFVLPPVQGSTGSGAGDSEQQQGLSVGVTAAIVVCSVLGLAALAAVTWWQWRKRECMKKTTEVRGESGYVDSEAYGGEDSYVAPSRGVTEVPMASFSR